MNIKYILSNYSTIFLTKAHSLPFLDTVILFLSLGLLLFSTLTPVSFAS